MNSEPVTTQSSIRETASKSKVSREARCSRSPRSRIAPREGTAWKAKYVPLLVGTISEPKHALPTGMRATNGARVSASCALSTTTANRST